MGDWERLRFLKSLNRWSRYARRDAKLDLAGGVSGLSVGCCTVAKGRRKFMLIGADDRVGTELLELEPGNGEPKRIGCINEVSFELSTLSSG